MEDFNNNEFLIISSSGFSRCKGEFSFIGKFPELVVYLSDFKDLNTISTDCYELIGRYNDSVYIVFDFDIKSKIRFLYSQWKVVIRVISYFKSDCCIGVSESISSATMRIEDISPWVGGLEHEIEIDGDGFIAKFPKGEKEFLKFENNAYGMSISCVLRVDFAIYGGDSLKVEYESMVNVNFNKNIKLYEAARACKSLHNALSFALGHWHSIKKIDLKTSTGKYVEYYGSFKSSESIPINGFTSVYYENSYVSSQIIKRLMDIDYKIPMLFDDILSPINRETPEDSFLKIMRSVDVYGESYCRRNIFNPEKVKEWNREICGKLSSEHERINKNYLARVKNSIMNSNNRSLKLKMLFLAKKVSRIIGIDSANQWVATIDKAIKIRNKLAHGISTQQDWTSKDLREMTTVIKSILHIAILHKAGEPQERLKDAFAIVFIGSSF